MGRVGAGLAAGPAASGPHPLHAAERIWPETNCYVDLWIEVLHALGRDPVTVLGCALAVDFEGDQWTFFKQSHADLFALHGIAVEELDLWTDLAQQLEEQLARGRFAIVEVDAFWLPDTAATTYRCERSKTSIAVTALDRRAERIAYFHNAGFFTAEGEDYRGLFRAASEALPPYVELVKPDLAPALAGDALVAATRAALGVHVAKRPRENPVDAYRVRFDADLARVIEGGLAYFHKYAFATIRQLGAAHDAAATLLDWLAVRGTDEAALTAAATDCRTIAQTAKALQLKLARAVHTKKPFDPQAPFDTMSAAWARVDDVVRTAFPR